MRSKRTIIKNRLHRDYVNPFDDNDGEDQLIEEDAHALDSPDQKATITQTRASVKSRGVGTRVTNTRSKATQTRKQDLKQIEVPAKKIRRIPTWSVKSLLMKPMVKKSKCDPKDLVDGLKSLEMCGVGKAGRIAQHVFDKTEEFLAEGLPRCFDICNLMEDERKLIIWLAQRGLIPNEAKCSRCSSPKPMYIRCFAYRKQSHRWICSACHENRTVKTNSAFYNSILPLGTIIQLIYLWCIGYNMEMLFRETDTRFVSIKTWLTCALRCSKLELDRQLKPLKGIIELEWNSVKKGTALKEGLDLLCGVERDTGHFFVDRCPQHRGAAGVLTVLQKYTVPGSTLITRRHAMFDGFALRAHGYRHFILEQSEDFAVDDVVIDLSEAKKLMDGFKSFVRRTAGPNSYCHEYFLTEMIIRRLWGKNMFPMIFYCIARAYGRGVVLEDVPAD